MLGKQQKLFPADRMSPTGTGGLAGALNIARGAEGEARGSCLKSLAGAQLGGDSTARS